MRIPPEEASARKMLDKIFKEFKKYKYVSCAGVSLDEIQDVLDGKEPKEFEEEWPYVGTNPWCGRWDCKYKNDHSHINGELDSIAFPKQGTPKIEIPKWKYK